MYRQLIVLQNLQVGVRLIIDNRNGSQERRTNIQFGLVSQCVCI